jgi:hypothetical protein
VAFAVLRTVVALEPDEGHRLADAVLDLIVTDRCQRLNEEVSIFELGGCF